MGCAPGWTSASPPGLGHCLAMVISPRGTACGIVAQLPLPADGLVLPK